MKYYHVGTMLLVLSGMICLVASPSFAGDISLQEAKGQFDRTKNIERNAEAYLSEARNNWLAKRAEAKYQRIKEKGGANSKKHTMLVARLKTEKNQKNSINLLRELAAVDKKLNAAAEVRDTKVMQAVKTLNRAEIQVRTAQKKLVAAHIVLAKALEGSTPPILQSVKVTPEGTSAIYDTRWIDQQNNDKNSGAEEDERQKLRRVLANLETEKTGKVKELALLHRARAPYVTDEVIAGSHYRIAAGEYSMNSQLAIAVPAITEAIGTVVAAYFGGITDIEGGITIVSKAVLADRSHFPSFVGQLKKNLAKRRARETSGVQAKFDVAKDSLIGDTMEEGSNVAVNGGVAWLAKKFPGLGKIIYNTSFPKTVITEQMNLKNIGKGVGISAVTATLKAAIAQHFQNKADKAELTAFNAYFDHQVAQQIINKSIQAEIPISEELRKVIASIAVNKALLAKSTPVWQRVEKTNVPLRDFQLDKNVRIELRFSRSLTVPPQASLGSQQLLFKATGGLPDRNFLATTRIKRPNADGEYNLPLMVRLGPDEKAYSYLDGNPVTAPVYNSKTSQWSSVEYGKDTSHIIQIFNLKALIEKMKLARKEIQSEIDSIHGKISYLGGFSEDFTRKALTAAGVQWSTGYSEHWGEGLAYPWELDRDGGKNYLERHVQALDASIELLGNTDHVDNDEFMQILRGMNKLREGIKEIKKAIFGCYFDHRIEQGKLWDKSNALTKKSWDLKPFEAAVALRKQADIIWTQGHAEEDAAYACFKSLKAVTAKPAFISIPEYRKLHP